MTVVLHAARCGQWPSRSAISTADDAQHWLEIQRNGWRDGDRLSFAVLEWIADCDIHPVLGNIVLKGHAPGKASADVGYWTAPGSRVGAWRAEPSPP